MFGCYTAYAAIGRALGAFRYQGWPALRFDGAARRVLRSRSPRRPNPVPSSPESRRWFPESRVDPRTRLAWAEIDMDSAPPGSPYLSRRLRSLDEVLADPKSDQSLQQFVRQLLADLSAMGLPKRERTGRAVELIGTIQPELSEQSALQIVEAIDSDHADISDRRSE